MGRTGRKRAHKKYFNHQTCEHKEELVLLNSWLTRQGVYRNKKLILTNFDNTGRGVMTKKRIHPGEELLNMPLNSTINVTTILMDTTFKIIFFENNINLFTKFKNCLSFQSLLGFYLAYLKVQRDKTKWHSYIESLPKNYTVPYFLPKNIQSHLDPKIISTIVKQNDVIETSYNIFVDILSSNISIDVLDEFKSNFSLDLYEWSYFTVNTRCVYMDLSKVINLKSDSISLVMLLNDNTNIALCPYLDMINHSPRARNETKLVLNGSKENMSIDNLNKDYFSEIKFNLYTNNEFDKFSQVFICYGDSYNIKLITEYGFLLPDNDLDYVPFQFEEVKEYLNKSNNLSQDQVTFINNHGLNKDLYIDIKGLSFNFYALLMVVKFYYKENSDVSRIIYSSMNAEGNNINTIIVPLVKSKILCIQSSIEQLRKYERCVTLDNCVELMCQYVIILEKFIKC